MQNIMWLYDAFIVVRTECHLQLQQWTFDYVTVDNHKQKRRYSGTLPLFDIYKWIVNIFKSITYSFFFMKLSAYA